MPRTTRSRTALNQTNGIDLSLVRDGDELHIRSGKDKLIVKASVTPFEITAKAFNTTILVAKRNDEYSDWRVAPRLYLDAHQPQIAGLLGA